MRTIGRCVECHGKLLLHRSLKQEVSTTLSMEAMSLVSWISETVVPSLNKLTRQDNTLRDLDLSGISSTDSPMNSPDEGIKRIDSHISSFPRMSLGLSDGAAEHGSFNVYQDQLKFLCAVEAAVAVMRSVMLIIISWVSICRNIQGSLIDHVVNWCQVLQCRDESVRKSLLPLFCRIALLCLANGSQAILLSEVLTCVDNSELNDIEKQTLASLSRHGIVSINDDAASQAGIASIVQIICSSSQKWDLKGDGTDASMPFLETISPGMKAIIMSLLKDNRGSFMLAQFLSNDTNSVHIKTDLFNEISKHAPRTQAIKKILKDWCGDHVITEHSNVSNHCSIIDDDKSTAGAELVRGAFEVVA